MQKWAHTAWSAGFRACNSCRRYGHICSRFRNTFHTVICGIASSRLARCTDFLGLCVKDALTRSTFSPDTRGRPVLIPPPNDVVKWRIMSKLLPERPLNCNHRIALRKLQNTESFVYGSRHFEQWCCHATGWGNNFCVYNSKFPQLLFYRM
jgi:hypothetical protein